MYCLIDICCICFDSKEHLQPLSDFGSDNITYLIKLTSCVPEMCFNQMNNKRLVCNKCRETMDAAYKFRQRCLRSKNMLTDYILQLHQISNISGVADVYLTDINKFVDIKKEYESENNIEKTEMFINMNENTIEKNFVINPTTEITGKNYIQLGNVIIKMEQENQNSDADMEETLDNLSLNQHDTKIDVSQNDIKLTASAMNSRNQDFEGHLHERFDNILETSDSENDDMAIKVEENNCNSLYTEKCIDDFSENLDEIKIDIVDNDIELMNNEINIQYKNEDIEEFSTEDNDLSSEDEDKTDKDTSSCLTTIETSESEFSELQDTDKQKIKNNKSHTSIHTAKKQLECVIYEKTFRDPSSLSRHMKSHSGGKDNACSVCHKVFTKMNTLKTHMTIHTKQYECDVCQKTFTRANHLKTHMRIHTSEKLYKCSDCNKIFTSSSGLKTHMRIHKGEKPHNCPFCDKKFTQSDYLQRHMRTHTGERPYKCTDCPQKFTLSGHLTLHMRTHTGEKPYSCKVCLKKFSDPSSLRKHTRIHTGEKPYVCKVCPKKFSDSSALRVHRYVHSGLKPYECEVCEKKFTRSGTLTVHMRTHSGEKPYACDVCLKKCSTSSNLKSHMRIHTAEIF